MKDLKDYEDQLGKKFTIQETILFNLFKDDDRYEFYLDENGSLAAKLVTK